MLNAKWVASINSCLLVVIDCDAMVWGEDRAHGIDASHIARFGVASNDEAGRDAGRYERF